MTSIADRLRIPVDQQDDWIIGTDKLKDEAAAEIERLEAEVSEFKRHLIGRRAEVEKLKAVTAHAAGFLDGLAFRIEHWVLWDSGEGDVESFAKAAEDCRTMAASITNTATWNQSHKPQRPIE